LSGLKILREYERAVIFRLGRLVPSRGPGVIYVIPLVERMVRVALRTITLEIPPQDVISRDNVSLKVSAVLYFRVLDPNKATVEIENYFFATSQLAQTTLRSVCGQAELDELLAEREKINTHIQEILDARSGPTGPQAGFREKIQNATEISSRNWTAFLLYAQARSEGLDLRAVEDARIDKQLGAPAAAAGSGSVVSKGSVPSILAFAVENGALTQSTSATTVTLRGNLVGWLDLVKNQGFIASYQDDSRFVRQLRRVSYSATLNTDAGSTTAPASAPSGLAALTPQAIHDQLDKTRQQLAGYSVRVHSRMTGIRERPRTAPRSRRCWIQKESRCSGATTPSMRSSRLMNTTGSGRPRRSTCSPTRAARSPRRIFSGFSIGGSKMFAS